MIHTSPYPEPVIPDVDLPAYVLEHVGRWAADPAVTDGVSGETVSYGELSGLVGEVGGRLVGRGIQAGDTVALMSPNQPWWAVAFYAVLAAGAVLTPVNPALTEREVIAQLRNSRARLLIADVTVIAKAGAVAAACGIDVVAIGDLNRGRRRPLPVVDPSSTAVVAYSSGTTGVAKGVLLTHRNLVSNLAQHEAVYHVAHDDVVLAALPLFHIYGMTIIMGYALRHGATIVTLPRFSLERYVATVAQKRVTWLHLAPPMVLALSGPGAEDADLSSVRRAVSGAAPLDAALAARGHARLGCVIGQGYGMTEASPGVTFVPDDDPQSCPPGSVGVLIPGTEARLVDPATGRDADEEGELWVRGPQVMAGYLDNPEATAASLVDGGWLRTGDLVRVDGGMWTVTDRLKELIKYKGYQVAPAELESVLLEHPAIADAAVIGVPDTEAGEIPKAFVVAGGVLSAEEVMAWVAGRVAPYKKVRAVELVDAIPKSPSGKILRRVLK